MPSRKKALSLTFTLYTTVIFLVFSHAFLSKKPAFLLLLFFMLATDDGLRDKLNNCILIAFPKLFYHKQISIIYKRSIAYWNWESYWHKNY
jgi:hypothetical protein